MPDIYDEEIERLTKDPDEIGRSWGHVDPLFKYADGGGPDDPLLYDEKTGRSSGCLTMIRSNLQDNGAFIKGRLDLALTAEIAADERLPKCSTDITLEHLPVFAEWQRRIDALQNQ